MVKKYSAYKGRNPKTGEIVNVPPKRLPHFRVGREMRKLVNRINGQTKQEILQAPLVEIGSYGQD